MSFADRVATFMMQWDYSDEEFGLRSAGNRQLIPELRAKGWLMTADLMRRIDAFMEGGYAIHAPLNRRSVPPQTMPAADLLDRMREFMVLYGYSDTEFGRRALGDPNFVMDVARGNRFPTLQTVGKLELFMQGGTARHALENRSKNPLPALSRTAPPRRSKDNAVA